MRFVPGGFCPEHTPIETLLTALSNCPNLEILSLAKTGPIRLSGHQGNRHLVVQLRRLRKLSISFDDLSGVRLVLSHIGYPESTKLGVYIPVCGYTDETVPDILVHRNVETIQHFRRSMALTVCLDSNPQFFTDNLLVCFRHLDIRGPQFLPRFASKIVGVFGMDTIVSLDIEIWFADLPDGMWEAFLHGLPRLERISYGHCAVEWD